MRIAMQFEKQLTNLELSKELKELGVKQDSWFYWVCTENANHAIEEDCEAKHYSFSWSAFTVAELGEMLPEIGKWRMPWKHKNKWYSDIDISNGEFTEADARAKLLIHLIK
jgi:hypothetical protein